MKQQLLEDADVEERAHRRLIAHLRRTAAAAPGGRVSAGLQRELTAGA